MPDETQATEQDGVQPHARDYACDGAAKELIEWSEGWRKRWGLTDIEASHILLQLTRLRIVVMGKLEREQVLARERAEQEASNGG